MKSAEEIAIEVQTNTSDFCSAEYPEYFLNLQEEIKKALNAFADSRLEAAAELCDKAVSEFLVSRIPGYVLAERIRTLKSKPSGEGKGVA